jgi:hypothetical protein
MYFMGDYSRLGVAILGPGGTYVFLRLCPFSTSHADREIGDTSPLLPRRSTVFDKLRGFGRAFVEDGGHWLCHSAVHAKLGPTSVLQDKPMTKFVRLQVAMLTLIGAASPASASPRTYLVARVQAEVDAAVERRAGFDSWKPESLDALRGHQPTSRLIAAAVTGAACRGSLRLFQSLPVQGP